MGRAVCVCIGTSNYQVDADNSALAVHGSTHDRLAHAFAAQFDVTCRMRNIRNIRVRANSSVPDVPASVVALNMAIGSLLLRCLHGPTSGRVVMSLPAVALGAMLMLIHGWFVFPLAATVTVCLFAAAVLCEISTTADTLTDERSETSVANENSAARWISIAMMFGSTLLLIGSVNLIGQLIQLNLPIVFMSSFLAALIITGMMFGIMRRKVAPAAGLVAAIAVLAMFPHALGLLTDWNLSITTTSGAFGMLMQRSVQLAIIVAASVLPAVVIARSESRSGTCLAVLIGMILAFAWLGRGYSVGLLMSVGMMIHGTALAMHFRQQPAVNTRSTLNRIAVVAALILAVMPSIKPNTDTSMASSLLFSPRTIAAIERGLSKDLIDQSDANRLIESAATDAGNISVWRRAGHVYEFQRNGTALGRVSADVRVTPQPPEDVLPVIVGLISHPQPGRVLLLGDDTGVCLRSSTNFPVHEIIALRSMPELTEFAKKFTWNSQETPADRDNRVQIRHGEPMVSLRDRSMKSFDVIVAAIPQFAGSSNSFQYTAEFYESIRERLDHNGVFCQRLKQTDIGPVPVKQVMASLMEQFEHVGVLQSVPGELILIGTNRDKGIVDAGLLSRMQRDHVKQEIAGTGLDWAQVAVLPFVDAHDPIGIFGKDRRPKAISIRYGGFSLCQPLDSIRRTNKSDEIRLAFAPHQVQLASTIPVNDDLKEAQRRLMSLQQQLEILAGMPDQPWTYRKSLRMEMQRDPRPPIEVVTNGQIAKQPHPLDELRKDYFITLGDALQSLADGAAQPSLEALQAQIAQKVESLEKFTAAAEPLMSHFAHFEIIRLHELAQLKSLDEEFRHRLHIVFFTTPTDASVRPVISALEQLVEHPELASDDIERYDLMNSLVQKLIERWEARTAWEPRSAQRVQNDVEKSVRVVNLALDQMERAADASRVTHADFLRRRRFVTAALIAPLRDYRDQVLAHRSKTESAVGGESPAEPNTEDANDAQLIPSHSSNGINTN